MQPARMRRVVRSLTALAVVTGATLSTSGAQAQTDSPDATVCVTIDFAGERMIDPGIQRTTPRAVDLPAGVVTIPSARATDTYPARGSITQNSERYEVEFLAADGRVVATSSPTGDVPDMVVFGEWVGDLGSVTLTEPAVAVRAHHRPDLPGDDTPQSVMANELTLCFGDATPPPVCGDPGVTNNPDGTPCSPPPVCGDPGVTNNPDGTPCSPTPPVTPTPETTTTTSGDVTGPTSSTTPSTAPSSTTAPPTTASPTTAPPTTAPPTTEGEEVTGPTTEQLPITGSSTPLLLALGAGIMTAGGVLVLARRRITA